MAGLTLKSCTPQDRGLLEAFVQFEFDHYRNDPLYVPPYKFEYLSSDPNGPGILTAAHPFHREAATRYFLAFRGRRMVGRIAAFVNERHNRAQNEHAGFFGFFECIPDPEVAQALLRAAQDYVRSMGAEVIYGPTSFVQNENETYGILVEGDRESLPYFGTTYNMPYYAQLIEHCGFRKAVDLLGYRLPVFTGDRLADRASRGFERLAKIAKSAQNAGIQIRRLHDRGLIRGLTEANQVYNAACRDLWGFVPVPDDDLQRVNPAAFERMYDSELYSIAYRDERPIGMVGYIKDLNEIRRRRLRIPGSDLDVVRRLTSRLTGRRPTRVRLFIFAVADEFHGTHVAPYLLWHNYNSVLADRRYSECELSWLLEENTASNRVASMIAGPPYRRWRVYSRQLARGIAQCRKDLFHVV